MAPGCIAPLCIQVKDHSAVLCEQLQQLRQQTGLVDLDIVCEGHYIKVHKVVMAASSKFFKEQLCKYNVQALVILRLEDFGLELRRDALNYIIEFIYTGEVNILGEKLTDFCQAAHNLGIIGLEHLPVPASRPAPVLNKDHILIADESELRVSGGLYGHVNPAAIQQEDTQESNSKLHPVEVNPFLNSLNTSGSHVTSSHDNIVLLHQVEREETNRSNNEGNVGDQQDIIPISFGDTTGLTGGECNTADQYSRTISEMLPRSIPEMLHDSNFPEEWSHSLFTNHASHHNITQPRQVKAPVSTSMSTLSSDIPMGLPGPHLQALFDAASVDIAQSGQSSLVKENIFTVNIFDSKTSTVSSSAGPASHLIKTSASSLAAAVHQSKSDSPEQNSSIITTSASSSATLVSPAASPRLQQSRPNSSLEFKQFGTTGSTSTGGPEYSVVSVPGVAAAGQGKVTPSPGKSISSQGKLRVINQGLHQSENIQTPSLRSLNLKESNKNRRRSGAHSHSGHIPSQVSQVALSAQVSHSHPSHASPAASGPSGAVRTSMRLMTVAAAVSAEASVAATETEETNAIAADNDSESESDEEQDNSVNNTGISTPLANWSAEDAWPTTNRENNWTHPVESVDTVPPSGAVWQLPANPPPSSGAKSNNSIAAWNIRDHSEDISNVQRTGILPWNIPITNPTWCSVLQEPAKWEAGHVTSTSVMTTCRANTLPTWTTGMFIQNS